MLDEYEVDQKVVYHILKNSVKKDKVSHAYLFAANGYKYKNELVLAFAKMLLCPSNYSNSQLCGKCTQCSNIDKNCFSEIKIIKPDGLWIKKEQLDDLQKEFSMKSLEAGKRIYIIYQADRLNPSSANTILKFLEEPAPNIIAILVTDNLYQVLDTIISRCQIISFVKNQKISGPLEVKIKNVITIPTTIDLDEKLCSKIDTAIQFVNCVETKKLDAILFTQRLWHENIIGREENIFAFDIVILFYKDVVNYLLQRSLEIFDQYQDKIEAIAHTNTMTTLRQKMQIFIKAKEDVKYNANMQLLLDKIIIEMNGGI